MPKRQKSFRQLKNKDDEMKTERKMKKKKIDGKKREFCAAALYRSTL